MTFKSEIKNKTRSSSVTNHSKKSKSFDNFSLNVDVFEAFSPEPNNENDKAKSPKIKDSTNHQNYTIKKELQVTNFRIIIVVKFSPTQNSFFRVIQKILTQTLKNLPKKPVRNQRIHIKTLMMS
jgi:hypothetical protein